MLPVAWDVQGGVHLRLHAQLQAQVTDVGRAGLLVSVGTEILGIDADQLAQQIIQLLLAAVDQIAEGHSVHSVLLSDDDI